VLKGMNVNPDGTIAVALDATIFTSSDDGATFDRGTTPAFADAGLVYRAFFDPKQPQHIVFGAATDGGRVTFDGGVTWTPSTGLSSTGQQRANLFEGVVSPVDGDVVWAAGIDIEETFVDPNGGRHIYRSDDGGLTFAVVASQTSAVTIVNGPMMAASPTDADVFYFVFGTFFQGYGTDLYRVVADGTVTRTHNDNHDISALVFAPDDSATLYLGLVHEEIN
jgi:hypothetical protein